MFITSMSPVIVKILLPPSIYNVCPLSNVWTALTVKFPAALTFDFNDTEGFSAATSIPTPRIVFPADIFLTSATGIVALP